ncbi:GNAT family N-acetyltransferase [Nostocoides sp. HKS02]|uniref:GNAT family N-acetyltransferase n=1 Tax=Nostocoides sp. HKS02 TaxID=1813880 RepID=UPI0012B4AF33|nr:GNAT family N-acetyltransferase [Tetrasphaera sp. HKS02]QGN56946.1 GNAT family N-acetyltransferase [Tetrasphaera sp. HKS02]
MQIRPGGLDTPQVAALLAEHLDDMYRFSPPESVHALDLDRLRQPGLTFWSLWDGEAVLGCAALRELDPSHAELKSMRTAPAHRRRGVAGALLDHVVAVARNHGYSRLSLETGPTEEFAPARALYAGYGFSPCGPFGPYAVDEFSVFMTLDLAATLEP